MNFMASSESVDGLMQTGRSRQGFLDIARLRSRRLMSRHRAARLPLVLSAVAIAGCGGAAALATSARSSPSASAAYATTPSSPGAVNPRAVPLGDGYVSTTPKVGY